MTRQPGVRSNRRQAGHYLRCGPKENRTTGRNLLDSGLSGLHRMNKPRWTGVAVWIAKALAVRPAPRSSAARRGMLGPRTPHLTPGRTAFGPKVRVNAGVEDQAARAARHGSFPRQEVDIDSRVKDQVAWAILHSGAVMRARSAVVSVGQRCLWPGSSADVALPTRSTETAGAPGTRVGRGESKPLAAGHFWTRRGRRLRGAGGGSGSCLLGDPDRGRSRAHGPPLRERSQRGRRIPARGIKTRKASAWSSGAITCPGVRSGYAPSSLRLVATPRARVTSPSWCWSGT